MLQRGNIPIGFDQNKINHNFIPIAKWGKIVIMSLNDNNTATINQIREHVKDIQNDFSKGNFTKPFFYTCTTSPRN